jgi:hypothetical protein
MALPGILQNHGVSVTCKNTCAGGTSVRSRVQNGITRARQSAAAPFAQLWQVKSEHGSRDAGTFGDLLEYLSPLRLHPVERGTNCEFGISPEYTFSVMGA